MYVPVSKSNLKSLDRQSWLQWASAFEYSCNILQRDRNLENVDVCTGATPRKPAASVSSKGSLTAQWTSFSKPGKHHVIWATSPAPGVFTVASLTGIKTGLACCIESKQRWKYLHGAEEGGGDRGQKEMEVALGCCEVSGPCPGFLCPVPNTEAFLVSMAMLVHALFTVFVYWLQPLIGDSLIHLIESKDKWYP